MKLWIVLTLLVAIAMKSKGNAIYAQDPNGDVIESKTIDESTINRIPGVLLPDGLALRRRCPLCDSSVYSYCSDKLLHDSCCCNNPNNPYEQLPYQCQYADCSFLHAKSCPEHKLITACCCTNLYLRKKRNI